MRLLKSVSVLSIAILFVGLTATTPPVKAQDSRNVSFAFKVGQGTYSMSSLKELQSEILEAFRAEGLNLEAVEEFPAYLDLGVQISIPFDRLSAGPPDVYAGAFLEFASTGGRIHYGDYSGEMGVDQLVSVVEIGAFLEKESLKGEEFSQFFTGKISYGRTSLKTETFLHLGNESSTDDLSFAANSFSIEGLVGFQVQFSAVFFRLNGGYQFDISSPFSYQGEGTLTDASGDEVRPEWSGWRFGLIIGLR